MQIFELILYILGIMSIGVLVSKIKLSKTHLKSFISFVALVFLIHLIFEAFRWQLVLIYCFWFLLIVHILIEVIKKKSEIKLRKGVLAILILNMFLSIFVLYAFPVYDIPAVSGSNDIGTLSFIIQDDSRLELYSEETGNFRKFEIQCWYPATSTDGYNRVPWLQDGREVSRALSKDTGLPGFVLDHTTSILSNSYLGAPIKDTQTSYPVVIISHGWRGFRNLHTDFAEELASQGYFVVSIDHAYGSVATVFDNDDIAYLNLDALPDRETTPDYLDYANQLVSTYAGDVLTTIDNLELINDSEFDGLLDLSRIGLLGHSTGGGGDITAALLDDRIDSVIGLDAWVEPINSDLIQEELDIPTLFLRSGQWETGFNNTNLYEIINTSNQPSYLYQIDETTHYDFSMVYMYSPLTKLIGFTGGVEGNYLNQMLETMIVDFFSDTLKNQTSTEPNIDDYVEVRKILDNQ